MKKPKPRLKGGDPTSHIFYKEGFSPLDVSITHVGNTAAVLIASGWRNKAMIDNPKKLRGKGLLAKVGDNEYNRIKAADKPASHKVYRKNEKSRLFRFVNGIYQKIIK